MNSVARPANNLSRVPSVELQPGLDNVYLAETRLSRVDGEAGALVLAGYAVEEIAPVVTFEEMVWLLWTGELPDLEQLSRFQRALAAYRTLPDATLHLLRAQLDRDPMQVLRAAASTLDLDIDTEQKTSSRLPPETDPNALAILARLPLVIAAQARLAKGLKIVEPRVDLSHAAHFLYLLHGAEPSVQNTRALDTYLNTVIDHGANASTFAARVITSTGSDLTSAVVGAIGALKGPLHGGAPGPALDMVFEIGKAERAEALLRAKLEAGERLMGFGHRVYKVRDPRAAVLGDAAARLYEDGEADRDLFQLAKQVEITAIKLLDVYKPGRRLRTNVEFYTALLLHGLGLDPTLFTPVFAMSRAAGWIAHCEEQRHLGRLIRPRLSYRGPLLKNPGLLEQRI